MRQSKLYQATLSRDFKMYGFYFYSLYRKGSKANLKDFKEAYARRYPDVDYDIIKIERVKTAKLKEPTI